MTPARRGCYNGFSLFWSSEMENRVPLLGESAEECRKRIMHHCQYRWGEQSQEGARLRALFSTRARELNKSRAIGSVVARENADASEGSPCPAVETGLVSAAASSRKHLMPLNSKGGVGTFGLGDEDFGIGLALVRQADSEGPGFVKNYNAAWRSFSGGVCGENKDLQNQRGVVQLSCQDQYGFCHETISPKDRFDILVEELKCFVRGHHRRHVKEGTKKSQGPQVCIPHPVLVARSVGGAHLGCPMGVVIHL